MNKMYKPIGFIAAVTAMSLVSCQKQELRPSTEGTTITVNATVEDAANLTKTSIEEVDGVYNINWDENEVMQAVVWNESKNNDVASSAFSKEADGTGIFSVTIPAGEWTNIAGIYPSESSSKASGDSQSRWRINLPTAQTPAAGSYDPKAYVLIARPATLPSDLTGYEYNAFYYRATALNRFRINNLEHGGNIVSARITFPEGQKVSGHKRVDLTTTTVTSYNANNLNYVDLNYAAAPLAATDSNYDLWFTTWGVSVSAEETVTVEITTEDYKYTKSFTGNTAEFKENCLNLLALNMTGAEAEELTPADDYSGEYLIVTTDGSTNWAYMSDYESSRFAGTLSSASASRDFATLTKDDFAGADDYIWTVSKVANGYTLYNAAKRYYLNLNSNSTTANTSDTAITLDVILNDDGTYQISYPGSTRSLRGNYVDRAWRFANYVTTGSQKDIYLLPWVESTEPALIVSEANKTVAADATEVVFEYTARNLTGDVTATVTSDESQIILGSPVVDAAASTVTVALNPNTDEVEKTATITLSADGVEPITLTVNQKAFVPESTTIKATVAEFLAAEVNDNVWYELTGTITDLYNTEYGNFHLVDETGTVRVYGLTAEKVSSNDKSFSSLGLKEGDIVTLIGTRTEYNNEAQVGGPAYYVSHVVAPYCNVSPSTIPVAADATSATFKVDANVEWKITSNNPTFTVSPASGTEAAEVTVSFPANESDEEVTVILTVSSELGDKTVTISQASASASTVVLLNEDFTGLSGDNTSNNGANSSWSGNDNFPTVTRAYQAGDAVKLGASKDPGSIESKPLTVPAGTTLTVAFDVKGWTEVEGDIEVTFNGETQTVSYSAVMSGSFESKSVSFVVNSETSSTVKFATTAKRAYLDNIVISYTK